MSFEWITNIFPITDSFQIFVVLTGIVLLSVALEHRFTFAKKLSPVLLILFIAATFSNTGIITQDTELYDQIIDFTIPFAVCLVLFQLRISEFKKTGFPLLIAFLIASIGTVVGVIVAGIVLQPFLAQVLGDAAWKLAGPFTGTYIGGSLNFFGLWEGLEIGNRDLLAAANAVDNLTLFPLFAIWIIAPNILGRFFPVAKLWKSEALDNSKSSHKRATPELKILDIVTLVFTALLIMIVSTWLKTNVIDLVFPQIPTIIIITTLALIAAQFKIINKRQGAYELGTISFYLFFASVGALMNFMSAIMLSPILFVYVTIIIVIHVAFTYGVGRIAKLDIRILTIASCAAKSGPPTVLALAQVKEWKSLALPGVAAGLLGYAIGNYIGFATAYLMKFLL